MAGVFVLNAGELWLDTELRSFCGNRLTVPATRHACHAIAEEDSISASRRLMPDRTLSNDAILQSKQEFFAVRKFLS